MSSVTLLDDTTRPKAPKIEGITPDQRRMGKRLAIFHRMHLQQLQEVADALQRVEEGEEALARLSGAISEMQMATNYRHFGNLCGQECQILTFHHTAEDQYIFPRLHQSASDGLKKVIARLREEHLVIHQALKELEARAQAAMQKPGAETFAALRGTFLRLDKLVQSHFGYEETELEEALGYFGIDI
jgi:iron-sulfur cluster repair protein YtfE (RIC family)